MSKIKADELGSALEQELTLYAQEVQDGVAEATTEAMKKLVKKTKATAPKGKRGSFRKNITATYEKRNRGRTFRATWHVKAPDHRLTHLLVHGHATKDGGRTKADPFLQNALDEVLPEYEKAVEEVLQGND